VENGYWTDTGTWDQGSTPTTEDTVIIEHFVQASYNLVVDSLGYLLVQASGQLCGRDLYMTVECGAAVDNYGAIYIDSILVYGMVTTYGLLEIFAAASVIGPCPNASFLVTGIGSTVNIKNVECDLTAIGDEYISIEALVCVYPNPFRGSATVELSQQSENSKRQLCIYDITGRKIKTYHVPEHKNTLTLYADEIGTGMFFVHLITAGNTASIEKVVTTR